MENPEVKRGSTPNGGDYSEFWYLDREGNAATTMETATSFKIIEYKNNGEVVGTVYGLLDK